MPKPEQLKLAMEQDELSRRRRAKQRAWMSELDEQLEAALARIEKSLGGCDVHKEIADRLTDDEQHPVSVTQVHDWLSRRNGRRPPAELLAVVYELDEAFASWWNTSRGYEPPKRLCLLPLEQERALLRKALAEFGAVGEAKLRAIALGGGR